MRPTGSKKAEDKGSMSRIKPMEGEIERASSRGDLSSKSFSSGILPPLGARSNPKFKLRPFIVSPFDSRYRYVLNI